MGKNPLSEQEILDYFSSWDLSEPARTYIPGHVNRYIFNLRMLKDIIKKLIQNTWKYLILDRTYRRKLYTSLLIT